MIDMYYLLQTISSCSAKQNVDIHITSAIFSCTSLFSLLRIYTRNLTDSIVVVITN